MSDDNLLLRIEQERASRELLEAQIAAWQQDVNESLGKICHALIGEVDSPEPGMKDLLRRTYEQAMKTNGRVNVHDEDIAKIKTGLSKVWYAVWGGSVTASAVMGMLVWLVDKGVIKLGG